MALCSTVVLTHTASSHSPKGEIRAFLGGGGRKAHRILPFSPPAYFFTSPRHSRPSRLSHAIPDPLHVHVALPLRVRPHADVPQLPAGPGRRLRPRHRLPLRPAPGAGGQPAGIQCLLAGLLLRPGGPAHRQQLLWAGLPRPGRQRMPQSQGVHVLRLQVRFYVFSPGNHCFDIICFKIILSKQ